jgi:RHS repeat-associated protein
VTVASELPLSSANGRAFLTSSGTRVAVVYPAAVNYRSSDGQWAAIDTTAHANSSGWVQQANDWNAQLPSNLSSPVTISRRGAQMSMALVGASGAGAAQSSTVAYAGALSDTSVRYTYLNQALKESLVLASADAPSSFSWDVTVPSGYSLRSVAGAAQVLDGAGDVVFDLVEPSVSDASGATGPTPTMSVTQNGTAWRVHVVVDSSWLSSSARVWPVTVDPTVDVSGQAIGQTFADCQITSATSGTACAQSPLDVGYDGSNPTRMLLSWQRLDEVLPWDAQVTQASVNVQVASRSNSTSVPLSMYPTTTAWDNSATWTATGYGTNWANPGGDYNTTTQTEANATVTGTGWYSFPDTSQISQAMSTPTAQAAFLFKESTENVSNTLGIYSWQDSSQSNWPYIQISYSLPTGTSPDSTFVAQHQLSDNSQIAVNPVDGDVVYQATDSNTAGIGLDQSLVRTYDSMSAGSKGDLGYGWFMNDGADTTLTQEPDGMLLRMFGNRPEFFQEAPGSTVTFKSPAGFDASLLLSGGVYTLTFNDSQQIWTFGHQIGSVLVLSTEKDRNANTITFNYTCGTTCTMGSITDTEGRTTTVAHNSNGYITSITDPTFSTNPVTRSVGYAYTNGSDPNQLTGVTDADSHSTAYVYDSSENLTQITDGDSNIIKLNYGSNPAAHQLLSITYAYGTSVAATWTFGYSPPASTTVTPIGATPMTGGSTSVTDPNGNTTVYDYNNQGEITSVTDPLGNQRSTTWTSANAKPNVLSDAVSTNDNSTMTWNANGNNELDSVALASSQAGTNAPAESTNTYGTSHSVSGYQYLASATTDPQGNCTSNLYDSSGNVTGSDAGGAMSGGACSSAMANSAFAYDGDGSTTCTGASSGELCSQTNPNSHTTSFAYDGHGNVASATPPSPDGESSYTYDGASRVVGTQDGNGNSGAPASIVPVQSVTQNVGSVSESSQTVTLTSNVTAGDALVMTVVGNPVSGTLPVVSSITGGGVTWVRGVSGGNSTVGDDEVWYGLNSSGGSGTTTITITMTASTPGIGAWIGEFSGVAASSALDTSGTNSGTGTTLSEPSMTTTSNGDLILGTTNGYNVPGSPPAAPWTDVAGPQYANGGLFTPLAYRTLASAGPVPVATWTQTSSAWATAAIALKPATQAAISQNLTTGCTAMAYDQDGRRTTTQFPGGATQTTSYTNAGFVKEITGATSTGSTIDDYTYNYTTSAHNDTTLVQTRVENDPSTGNTNLTTTYSYDALNRLTKAVASSGTNYYYGYDADGNMNCSQTSGACSSGPASGPCTSSLAFYYNNDDELTCDTAGSFSYDADGNNTSTPTLSSLTYNTKNQTSATTQSGTTTNYTYTGADSSQRTAAGSVTFVPDGDDISNVNAGGATAYYTYDANGNMIGWRQGSSSYYYLYDNMGSVVAVINSSGTVEDRYSYTPYGNQTTISSSVTNSIGFQGGNEEASGLIKFGARYYNPTTAAWTQPDPTGQNPGYLFDEDDPINETDPSGGNVCKSIFGHIGLGGACKAVTSPVASCVAFVGGGLGVIGDYFRIGSELSDTAKAFRAGKNSEAFEKARALALSKYSYTAGTISIGGFVRGGCGG